MRCGIPTWYKAVRFRSRLEARWAAVFDFLGWSWEYEPAVDQEVEGWLPDFALATSAGVWLVECKPALAHDAFGPAEAKVEASGYRGAVVLLGAVWGVSLASVCDRGVRRWRPAYVAWGNPNQGPVLRNRPEPDAVMAWWLRLGWVMAGNRTQWRRR